MTNYFETILWGSFSWINAINNFKQLYIKQPQVLSHSLKKKCDSKHFYIVTNLCFKYILFYHGFQKKKYIYIYI